MRDVARAMLFHHKVLLDRKEGKNKLLTDKALSHEPYYLLQPSSVCHLFKQSMVSQPVQIASCTGVLPAAPEKPRDHKELRECVNKHSILAGRNPLVSSASCTVPCDGMFLWCVQEMAELKEEDIISHTATVTQLHTILGEL